MLSTIYSMICRLTLMTWLVCLVMGVEAQTGPFRFAQLSDLHFSATNRQAEEALKACIEQINTQDSVDFVLVTGDLSEEGDKASLQRVKATLDLIKAPCYTIMGNHETKWSASGCTAFSAVFGGERIEFTHQGVLFLGFNSGPLMRMALGHVVPQDIRWMQERMEQHGRQNPTILFTHYPILPGDVDNYYEVTDAVRHYNVRLFVGGHYHSFRNLRYDGIPGILTRSTLPDKEHKSGYGLFEVGQDSIYVYQRRVGEVAVRKAAFALHQPLYEANSKADQYPDYRVNEQYPQVKSGWLIQSGVGIYCAPAADKRQLYVADDEGKLTAYRLSDGTQLWQAKTSQRIVGSPATAEGVVVVGSADGAIYGFETATGRIRWKVEAEAPVLGAVTIAKGIAYVGASDGCMRAIRLKDGQLVWQYNKVKGYIETRPFVDHGQVIFGAWDNTLYALDSQDGRELWRWDGGLTRMHFSPATVWPAGDKKRLFIVDPQRALTAIDRQTGATIYRTFQSKVRESMGFSQDKKRIYAKTMNDSVVCYDAQSDYPRQIWATDVGFGYEHAPSMPQEYDGIVYGGTKEGLLYALDAKTGVLVWKHKVGNSLINTLLPVGKGEVIFTSTDGQIGHITSQKQ